MFIHTPSFLISVWGASPPPTTPHRTPSRAATARRSAPTPVAARRRGEVDPRRGGTTPMLMKTPH
eukprot:7076421-Pyramimonas_sp.AAC.1